jgi:hypothetical protein
LDRLFGGGRHDPEAVSSGKDRRQVAGGRRPDRPGEDLAEAAKALGMTDVNCYRWRQEYGGLTALAAKRLKELEKGNERLRKAVARGLACRNAGPSRCWGRTATASAGPPFLENGMRSSVEENLEVYCCAADRYYRYSSNQSGIGLPRMTNALSRVTFPEAACDPSSTGFPFRPGFA